MTSSAKSISTFRPQPEPIAIPDRPTPQALRLSAGLADALTASTLETDALVCTFDGPVDYALAAEFQQNLLHLVASDDLPPVMLLLEHPLVATLGRGAAASDAAGTQAPVIRSHRGGRVTVHGPGQVVGYPILNLRRHHLSVHAYVRALEKLMQAVCRQYDITTEVRDGLTGLWTQHGKIGSIGIAVRRGITWHGFALYVSDQRDNFGMLNPCALPGVLPDCLAAHVASLDEPQVTRACAQHFAQQFELARMNYVQINGLQASDQELTGTLVPTPDRIRI